MTLEELKKIIDGGETLTVEFKSDRDKLSDRALVVAVRRVRLWPMRSFCVKVATTPL